MSIGLLAAPAFAQDGTGSTASAPGLAQNGSTGLQEIVVTARKQQESLQKVPLSIQAVDTKRLEELHTYNLEDISKYAPAVSIRQSMPGRSLIFMRGISPGPGSTQSGNRATVATYLDEQPVTTIGGSMDTRLYDIARVEVLPGPQGTLYGASSEAGTLRIITNKPEIGKFEAAYDVQGSSVKHGGYGYSGEGYVNIPISDRAAARIVAYYDHQPGYIDNVFGSRTFSTGITVNNAPFVKKDYNDVTQYGGRFQLKYELSDDWSITPSIIGEYSKSHGNFRYNASLGDLQVQRFQPEVNTDRWYQAALTVQGKVRDFDIVYSGGHADRTAHKLLDYTEYTYSYDQLYGYAKYAVDNAGNYINPVQANIDNSRYKIDAHELRISSPSGNRLRGIVGAFYERQQGLSDEYFSVTGLATAASVTGLPGVGFLNNYNRVDTDSALFGEAYFDIIPSLTLTGGIRGYKAKSRLGGFFGGPGTATCIAPASTVPAPCTNFQFKTSSTGETHKLNLAWRITNNKMIYATYSTGFRPGGLNKKSGTTYTPDTLVNYEIGWKTSWLDDHLRWNGAIYREDFNNFQFSFIQKGFTEYANAASARIYGIESDASFKVDSHLTITGSGSYIHSTLAIPYCGTLLPNGQPDTSCANPLAPKGARLPLTPRFKGNLSLRYEAPIGTLTGYLQGAASHQSFSWADLRTAQQRQIGKQQPYTAADFSAGLHSDKWSLEIFLLNAFDTRAQLSRAVEGYLPNSDVFLRTIRPRTLAVKIGQKF